MLNKYLNSFEKIIIPQLRLPEGKNTEYWRSVIEDSGSTLLKVFKIRKYSREVFLVQHPIYGKCVLKTSCPVREPKKGFANMSITKVIDESNPGIFPQIYESASFYTFEEYINGMDFRTWMEEDYNASSIQDYFTTLKHWSISCAGKQFNDALMAEEIRILCKKYIRKCIRHLKYSPPAGLMRSSYIISRHRKSLAEQSEWLWQAAEDLKLPKGMMCGDMGIVNILVESKSNRFYNIDYEYMGTGHHGFDAVYFVVSIFNNLLSDDRRRELTDLLLTDEYLGGQLNGEYFRALANLLIEIDQIVFNPDQMK